MKAVKFLPAIALALPCFLSASASDYKPMIRYDRVWECVDGYPDYIIKCMRFDGTEEINGQTYHRLVTFLINEVIDYDDETGEFCFHKNYTNENEGYMREEEGVVYTLVDKEFEGDCGFGGSLYISSDNLPHNNVEEAVIYDFNPKVGEPYNGATFSGKELVYQKLVIAEETSVDIAGEKCRQLRISPYSEYDSCDYGDAVIEGIGAIDYGCLTHTEFVSHPNKMWWRNYLTRVLDMNANVIFDNGYNYNVPYEGGFSAVESIHEGSRMLVRRGLLAFGEDGHRNGIRIIDMGGQQAASAEKEGRVSLSTAGLAPGVYIAVASTDGNITDRHKILVSNNN